MVPSGRAVRRAVIDAGMHALAGVADWMPPMRRRMAKCRLIADLEYARHGGLSQRLDILRPQGAGPFAVIVYLHGGAFAVGSKRTHRAVAAAYASQGYLVCNVDYRLSPRHPFPAALEDACGAWLWTLDHVGQYGGDPRRIVLAGESAGANLALAVMLACSTPRPEAFAAPLYARGVRPAAALLYCGFLQVSNPGRHRRIGVSGLASDIAADAARAYLGRAASHPGPEHALADPLCVVEALEVTATLPPIFMAAGLDDPVLPDTQRLEQALQRLQSPHTARFYPGQGHAFHIAFWRDEALRCWRDSFAFLNQRIGAVDASAGAANPEP